MVPHSAFGTDAGANREERTAIVRPAQPSVPTRDGPRVNGDIRASRVRLIGETGDMIGIIGLREALDMAEEAELDLIEISPNADPPVCKIGDLGKFKYEAQKRAHDARRNQKVIEVKEIKMRPGIDDHDYEVKMRAMKRFLEEGDKVKVTLRFRGREMVHQDIGANVLARVRTELDALAKVEQFPRMEGRQMIMVLMPK
jgi:translation initiation factor IF-3